MKKIFYNSLIISLISVSIVLQQYAIFCQIGLTYDSFDYLYAAQTFNKNYTLYNANQSIYVERTPLFPLILSLFGQNVADWAKYLQAICLVFTLLVWWQLAKLVFQQKLSIFLFLILQVFSTPILLIHSFLWSEAIFLTLFSGHLLALFYYCKNLKKQYLWGMIILSFLFCLQRNPGIFIVIATASSLFWILKIRFSQVVLYIFPSSSGWLAWTMYAWQMKGANYHPLLQSLFKDLGLNFYECGEVISLWILPIQVPNLLRISILLIFLTLFIFSTKNHFFASHSNFKKSLILIFLINLLVFNGLALSNGFHEAERYWAVVYPWFFFMLILSMENYFSQFKNLWSKRVFIVLISFWLLYPISRSLKNVHFWHQINCKNELLKP